MEDAKIISYFDVSGGINTYTNPLLKDGQLIHAVNVTSFPYGAKTKRTGYSSFLSNPDNSKVNSLFEFQNISNSGSMNLYRVSGSQIYYSTQGTGDWTVASNGTIAYDAHFGQAILNNVLIGGDGQGSTRHSVNGTAFVDTTLAPPAEFFEEYQGRIYAGGTASTLFYSSANDGTNWQTSGTSDSNSLQIPGAGKMGRIFKVADKLIVTKSSGIMNKWDGYSRIDMATRYGPSSPYSVAKIEGHSFFANQYGEYAFGGDMPQLISNPIQRQFYNAQNTGIVGTLFPTLPGECHIYDYLLSVGNITDDFTGRSIQNSIIKYDYQKNDYLNWSLANRPTSWLSFKDPTGAQTLIFGNTSGQVYKFDNSTTDNGNAITSEMVFVYHAGRPDLDKKWNWWRGIFNPGCEAKVQIACSDAYQYQQLRWFDLGDTSSGAVEFRFPDGSRSHFLFVRIYEASKTARFSYYGCSINSQLQTVLP